MRICVWSSDVCSSDLYDIGSGAGLPGVVLAIMRPSWQVACVDAVEKKMAFVRQMSGVLALHNLRALHARVEDLPPAGCDIRSEERRVGKEWVNKGRFRWWPDTSKKKNTKKQ